MERSYKEFQESRESVSDEEEYSEIDEEDEQLHEVFALLNFSDEQDGLKRRENMQRAEKSEDKCQKKGFRPGDWVCVKWANIYFQFRSLCNLCGTSREESESLVLLLFSLKKKESQKTVQKKLSTESEHINKNENN